MIADSTFLIDVLRGEPAAIRFLTDHPDVATTDINLFEVLTGALLTKRNPHLEVKRALDLRNQMDVFPLDERSIRRAAEINAQLRTNGKPVEELDCIIAGIALAHGHTDIVTENRQHFERIPSIKVCSYWPAHTND